MINLSFIEMVINLIHNHSKYQNLLEIWKRSKAHGNQ